MKRNFMDLLRAKWAEGKFVCVGLDSELENIPVHLRERPNWEVARVMVEFNEAIVRATRDVAGCYKPNSAFYEKQGVPGMVALRQTISDIHRLAPDVPVILDAKRGDIGNTNTGYVGAAFDFLGADAITIHPYLGEEAMEPFLACEDKGVIVLCRTSNKGAGEFQDLQVSGSEPKGSSMRSFEMPLYQYVAKRVSKHWNKRGNCAVVVGATYPNELKAVRMIVGDMPILIPGVGKQGGDVQAVVVAGKNSRNEGMIINSSSAIIFASSGEDFAEAARGATQKLHNTINQHLQEGKS